MLSTFQLAAVSAVLSGLVVGIWDADARTSASSSTKTFLNRVPESAVDSDGPAVLIKAEERRPTQSTRGKGDRSASAEASACADAAWPYVPQKCHHLTGKDGPRSTVETHEDENTSILMRVPQTTVASR